MNKIFNKFFIGVLFLIGIILIPTFKVNASVNVSISIDGDDTITSKTISYGGRVKITWSSTGGTTNCNRYENGEFKENLAARDDTGFWFSPTSTTTLTITCYAPDPLYYKLQRCTDGMIFETGPFPDGTYDTGGELLVGSAEYSTYNYIVIDSSTSSYLPEASYNISATRSGLYSCPPVDGGGGGGGGGGEWSCVYLYGEPPYSGYCSEYKDSYNCEQGGHDCDWTNIN